MTVAWAGVMAGIVHVLSGPDHLAAIAPYAVADRSRSWSTGVRWGLGHSAAVLAVGLLVLVGRRALPIEALAAHSELGVGLALLVIGIAGIRSALRHQRGHVHGRAVFAVGTLHGLAGSSHLLGILPALALASDAVAGAYLLSFGMGSIVAMGIFAAAVGWVASRRFVVGEGAQRALLGLCSVVAAAIGCFWVVSNLPAVP